MQLLDNETFLKQLTDLFESSKTHGSIWLTHKRLTYDGEDAAVKQETEGGEDTREYPCIIRASDGGAVKFSTHVGSTDLAKFHAHYGTLLKTSMTPLLRKRDKKREKIRAEQIAQKKKRMAEPVAVQGPKRGNGRRKRQMLLKAASKQQEREEARKQKAEASSST